tara:strand:+ start:362 stop:673 length:312 start_codon:yes stop_codon:yes gene_type:complete
MDCSESDKCVALAQALATVEEIVEGDSYATLTLESLTRLESALRVLLNSSTLDPRSRDAFRMARATLACDDWLSAYDGGPIAVARAGLKVRINDIACTLEEYP